MRSYAEAIDYVFAQDVDFDIRGHPQATHGYGWGYVTNEEGGRRFFTVLEIPPVDSPQTAMQARDQIGDSECAKRK